MPDLTFGEQVKIVLSRKGMTIKELAKKIEQRTGKKMSRQNLTQRLGRDNFQEQDMRMIASILECPLKLSILGEDTPNEKEIADIAAEAEREAAAEERPDEGTAMKEKSEEEAAGTETEERGHADAGSDGEGALTEETKEEHAVSTVAADTEEAALHAGEDIIEEDIAEETFEEDEAAGEALAMEAVEEEAADGEDSGRDITVGEFLEIRKSSGESAQEQLMQELLAEMDSIEREDRERNAAWELRRQEKEKEREQQEAEKKAEKRGGWMSRFRFRKREETPEPENYSEDDKETAKAADEASDSAIGSIAEEAETAGAADSLREENRQESRAPGQANTFSDRIREYTLQDNELLEQLYEDEEEDLEAGDVNPYTGHEYLSNSVRMHPKRIGYVQVYNRKDHRWTDMTEWAFLGYQERKKVLLGKDYEPPIYLD